MPYLPDRDALRAAAAVAYGVPPGEVEVGEFFGDADPFPRGRRVYINLWRSDGNGDLPVSFDQAVDETLAQDIDTVIQSMAEKLGMMIVTDDIDQQDPLIHLPDGTTQQQPLEELPDGGKTLPPDLKAIAQAEQPVRAA